MSDRAPVVHLMVPAYGPSPYLVDALTSASNCLDADTHLTVVDDGSPDEQVRAAAASADPRVEYVRLQHNRGIAGAFQACADLSRGEYTVLMGSDDLLEPSYIEQVRRLVRAHGSPAMVHPGVTVVGVSGEPAMPVADRVKAVLAPRRERLLQGDRFAASLLLGNWTYFPAIAWRTEVLRRCPFRQDLQTALDLDLALRMVFDGEALAFSPVPAFRYRRHVASASSRSAASGERYREERALFRAAEARARAMRWRRSAWAARLHPTARLHVAVLRAATLGASR